MNTGTRSCWIGLTTISGRWLWVVAIGLLCLSGRAASCVGKPMHATNPSASMHALRKRALLAVGTIFFLAVGLGVVYVYKSGATGGRVANQTTPEGREGAKPAVRSPIPRPDKLALVIDRFNQPHVWVSQVLPTQISLKMLLATEKQAVQRALQAFIKYMQLGGREANSDSILLIANYLAYQRERIKGHQLDGALQDPLLLESVKTQRDRAVSACKREEERLASYKKKGMVGRQEENTRVLRKVQYAWCLLYAELSATKKRSKEKTQIPCKKQRNNLLDSCTTSALNDLNRPYYRRRVEQPPQISQELYQSNKKDAIQQMLCAFNLHFKANGKSWRARQWIELDESELFLDAYLCAKKQAIKEHRLSKELTGLLIVLLNNEIKYAAKSVLDHVSDNIALAAQPHAYALNQAQTFMKEEARKIESLGKEQWARQKASIYSNRFINFYGFSQKKIVYWAQVVNTLKKIAPM